MDDEPVIFLMTHNDGLTRTYRTGTPMLDTNVELTFSPGVPLSIQVFDAPLIDNDKRFLTGLSGILGVTSMICARHFVTLVLSYEEHTDEHVKYYLARHMGWNEADVELRPDATSRRLWTPGQP